VRFEVSRVLDTVEQRLTTDVTLAQAVVDLADVARFQELDGGRSVNLLRIGMVLDAMAQYLLDGAAMLYPVAGRELMADQSLTSKERMVLGRWLDDGRIEAVPMVGDRVIEVADFTGMPVIARRNYRQYAERFPWVTANPERVLRLERRPGKAVLIPGAEVESPPGEAKRTVATYAAPERSRPPEKAEERVFVPRSRQAQTRVSTRAIEPAAAPSSLGATLLARSWRCPEDLCPSFGPGRLLGEPVPRLLKGLPCCPRHEKALTDTGSRPAEYPVAVVIDDVVRRRFPVSGAAPVHVGRTGAGENDIPLKLWLHESAAGWIADRHLSLEIIDGGLIVTGLGENGLTVWHREAAGEPGESVRLYEGQRYALGPHDSIELYTGVELVPGNRRVVGGPVSAKDVLSVLADAPTVALRAHSSP
jgi:hypothetical protein